MKRYYTQKAGCPSIWALVFFVLMVGCSSQTNKEEQIIVQWENGQPRSIRVSLEALGNIPKDSLDEKIDLRLKNSAVPILGQKTTSKDFFFFKPVIPFTRGLIYEIWLGNKMIRELNIPREINNKAPEIIAVYPDSDTVPENLLKIHIAFSRPMQEGQALKNISVILNNADTISPFLDLDTELWNKDGDLITVWLDPGRIKRELQPNLSLGNPLKKGNRYKIFVSKEWRDKQGNELNRDFSKNYIAVARDSISPNPARWAFYLPEAGTRSALSISIFEPLDFVLLKNAIHILDSKDNILDGEIVVDQYGSVIHFIPTGEWKPGFYTMETENRLEDLSGNNIARLFDEVITIEKKSPPKNYKRQFQIREEKNR